MGNRDLLLILNIVNYLIETSESSEGTQALHEAVEESLAGEQPTEHQPHKTERTTTSSYEELVAENNALKAENAVLQEQVASQQQMAQMTIEQLVERASQAEQANDSLKTQEALYKRQGEIMMEQVDAQLSMMQMTIEFLNDQLKGMEAELDSLSNHETQYKRQGAIMMEQVDSQLSMMQMTIEFLTSQIGELEQRQEELSAHEKQYKRQGEIMMEQVDAQLSMMQMTIEFLSDENKILEDKSEKLEEIRDKAHRQELILIEQIESQLQMFQMTHEYHMEQIGELENQLTKTSESAEDHSEKYMSATSYMLQQYFDPKTRLQPLFPEVMHHAASQWKTFNCAFEKFGIIYIVTVRAPFNPQLSPLFSLCSNFILNNIIGIRKYVNPSRIIEEYLQEIEKMANQLPEVEIANLDLSVCLIDNVNLEAEFASTGLLVYSVFNRMVEEHAGGKADKENTPNGMGRLGRENNTYKIRKLSFRKGTYMFLSSELPSATFESKEKTQPAIGLKEILPQWAGLPKEEIQEKIEQFVQEYTSNSGELLNDTFTILGIQF